MAVLRVPGLARAANGRPADGRPSDARPAETGAPGRPAATRPAVAVARVAPAKARGVVRSPRHVAVARVSETREPTSVLTPSGPVAVPVFVDESGRRRRLVSRVGFAVALLAMLLVAGFWLSQAGAPVDPGTVGACDRVASGGCPAAPANR